MMQLNQVFRVILYHINSNNAYYNYSLIKALPSQPLQTNVQPQS